MTLTISGKIRQPQATLILGGASHSMPLLWSVVLSAICFFFSISPDSSVVSSPSCLHEGYVLIVSLDIVALPMTIFFWYLATGIVSVNFDPYSLYCISYLTPPPNFVQPDQTVPGFLEL